MPKNRSEQKRNPAEPPTPPATRDRGDGADADHGEELAESQRHATEDVPQNFRDEANADKTVEIGPDLKDRPIQGIDPVEHGRKER